MIWTRYLDDSRDRLMPLARGTYQRGLLFGLYPWLDDRWQGAHVVAQDKLLGKILQSGIEWQFEQPRARVGKILVLGQHRVTDWSRLNADF